MGESFLIPASEMEERSPSFIAVTIRNAKERLGTNYDFNYTKTHEGVRIWRVRKDKTHETATPKRF